jgi:hypothetical protein
MPDNGIAVEPREAQRPTSLAARTPQAAILGNGDIAVGATKRTLARSVREPRKLPGASRRSIPSYRGEKEKWDAGHPGPEKQRTGAAERWLIPHCHSGARAQRANPESRSRHQESISGFRARTLGASRNDEGDRDAIATAASCLRAAPGSRLLPDPDRARAGAAIRR